LDLRPDEGDAGAGDGGGVGGRGDRVPGAQGQRQGQLVRHLPAVRRLLRAHLGLPHRLLRGHGDARAPRTPLRRRAGAALAARWWIGLGDEGQPAR